MFWVFLAANAPEAVGRMTAKSSVVLVNIPPIAKNHWRISVSGTSTSRQKVVPAMPITPTSAKDNFLTRHHIFMMSNIVL
jgi:hypothetical protein